MKRYTRGYVSLPLLAGVILALFFLVAGIGIAIWLPIPGFHPNASCNVLHQQITEAKNHLAARDRLYTGQSVNVERLREAVPGLSFTNGAIICPHGCRVRIGTVGEQSKDGNREADNALFSCAEVLKKIQRAKVSAAKIDQLRWDETPNLEQLRNAGCDLVADASGTVRCPEGGAISIGPIGGVPTCSRHTIQPTTEKEGGTAQ